MRATTPTTRLIVAAAAAGIAATAVVAGAAPGQAAGCSYPNVCPSVAPAAIPAAAAGAPAVQPAAKKTVTTPSVAPGKITLPTTSFASTVLKNGSLTITAAKLKPNAVAKLGFQGTTYSYKTAKDGTLTAVLTPKNPTPGVSGIRMALPTSSGKIVVTWRKITVPATG